MKGLKVSENLICEVLNLKPTQEFNYSIEDNQILISDFGEQLFEINIYEFAFKCKEWALDNCWIITNMPLLTEKKWRYTSVRLSRFCNAGKDRYLCGIYRNGRIEATTEIEAIFKACEWVLKEAKNNI